MLDFFIMELGESSLYNTLNRYRLLTTAFVTLPLLVMLILNVDASLFGVRPEIEHKRKSDRRFVTEEEA